MVSGWQWVSINLSSPSMSDVNTFMGNFPAENGDQVKSRKFFDQYDHENGWIGTITQNGGLSNLEMYKFKLGNAGVLAFEGALLNPSSLSITIENGWNWIGFVSQRNMNINEALANFDAIEDDQIKSQREFAIYSGPQFGWIGNLSTLVPGQGFLLFSGSTDTKTFSFPEKGISNGRISNKVNYDYLTKGSYTLDVENYSNNMSLVAEIDAEVFNGMDTLIALVNGEVRGIATPQHNPFTERNVYFITIMGNTDMQSIHFLSIADQRQIELSTGDLLDFESDKRLGSLRNPVKLFDLKEFLALPDIIKVKPNPFNDNLNIELNLEEDSKLVIEIFNTMGQKINRITDNDVQAGSFTAAWDGKDASGNYVTRGIYLVRFEINGSNYIERVVKE